MKIVTREPKGIVDHLEVLFLRQGSQVGIIEKFLLTQEEYHEFEQYVCDNIPKPDKRTKGMWWVDYKKDRPTLIRATFRGIPVLPPDRED